MSQHFDLFVLNIGADLYSAALLVRDVLRPILHRSLILFDKFDCDWDEMSALNDFCCAFGYEYTVRAAANACEKVAIRFNPDDVL